MKFVTALANTLQGLDRPVKEFPYEEDSLSRPFGFNRKNMEVLIDNTETVLYDRANY